MSLHFETSHPTSAGVKRVNACAVQIMTEDGRCMFEVLLGKDGRSIEVLGVNSTKVDGVIYTERLDLRLNVSNRITIRVRPYDED